MGEMLVANSFDLWQRDAFFSAAEEVQQSADIMESAYRTWVKAKREGLAPQHLDELGRELQMALGTAKWQLEEFERAVCLSYRKNSDDITITRHRQFVSAIEHQISRIETVLRESLYMEGKKPFRWVDLDEEECDNLALFLSGSPRASKWIKDESIMHVATITNSINRSSAQEDCSLGSRSSSKMQIPNQGRSSEESFMKLTDSKMSEARDEISHRGDQITGNQGVWSSASGSALEIVIDDNNDRHNDVLTEATPKDKGSKPFFWSSRGENYHGAKGTRSCMQMKMVNWINQLRGDYRSQRQQPFLPVLFINSRRYILILMLIIFLAVPFLLYSA